MAQIRANGFDKNARGQRIADYSKLRLPIFGGMFHKLYLSRSLSTMGTMITSGVQVLDCLAIVKDVAIIPLINRTFATSGISKSLKGVDPSPWDSEMYNMADWSK